MAVSIKPATILAITIGVVMLIVQSVYATGLDRVSLSLSSPDTTSIVRLPGHILGALKKAKQIKSAPDAGDQRLTLTLTLNHDDEDSRATSARSTIPPRQIFCIS